MFDEQVDEVLREVCLEICQSPGVRGSAFDEDGDSLGLGLGELGLSGAASSEAGETLEGEGESLQAGCGLESEPLDEDAMLATIKALSHGENIPQ